MLEVTAAEKAIADALGEVWNAYLALPVEHPMEAAEFCQGVHALQNMVLARAGCRAINPARGAAATRNPEDPYGY